MAKRAGMTFESMDFISHGLWSGVAFGRKSKKYFLWSFLIGIAPDVLSFGIFMAANVLGILGDSSASWQREAGTPPMDSIPVFVHVLYNFTHSLVIFGIVFLLVWLIWKKPVWPLLAWGLHILVDIPSHSDTFFPTPFLYPISDFHVNGINWGNPIIFFPNWILLFLAYGGWWLYRKCRAK